MTTPKASATQSNRNPGNRRTGRARGFRAQKGGAHQIPWREDVEILHRLSWQAQAMAEGSDRPGCLVLVNAELAKVGGPPITLSTLDVDRVRLRELATDEALDAKTEVLRSLREARSTARRLIDETAASSLNRSGYLAAWIRADAEIARLSGAADAEVIVRHEGAVAVFRPSPEDIRTALEVLGPRFASFPEPASARAVVVDAVPIESPVRTRALPAPKPAAPQPAKPAKTAGGIEIEDFEPDALPPAPAPGVDDGWDRGFETLRGGGGGGGMASRFSDFGRGR